jgi:hypothetical protein
MNYRHLLVLLLAVVVLATLAMGCQDWDGMDRTLLPTPGEREGLPTATFTPEVQ